MLNPPLPAGPCSTPLKRDQRLRALEAISKLAQEDDPDAEVEKPQIVLPFNNF